MMIYRQCTIYILRTHGPWLLIAWTTLSAELKIVPLTLRGTVRISKQLVKACLIVQFCGIWSGRPFANKRKGMVYSICTEYVNITSSEVLTSYLLTHG